MLFVTTAHAEEAKPAVEGGEDHSAHGAAGETVHTETGVAHGEEHGGVFPPFDSSTYASQLLWLALTFGAFYLLLSRSSLRAYHPFLKTAVIGLPAISLLRPR